MFSRSLPLPVVGLQRVQRPHRGRPPGVQQQSLLAFPTVIQFSEHRAGPAPGVGGRRRRRRHESVGLNLHLVLVIVLGRLGQLARGRPGDAAAGAFGRAAAMIVVKEFDGLFSDKNSAAQEAVVGDLGQGDEGEAHAQPQQTSGASNV